MKAKAVVNQRTRQKGWRWRYWNPWKKQRVYHSVWIENLAEATIVFGRFLEGLRQNAAGLPVIDENLFKRKPVRLDYPKFPCCYFIQMMGGNYAIKIGFTEDLRERLSHLQVGNSHTLRVLNAIPGSPETEDRLHGFFAELHCGGEWFRPDLVLMDFINQPRPFDFMDGGGI